MTIVVALLHFVEQWFFGFEDAFAEVVSQVNWIGQFFDPWQKGVLAMAAVAFITFLCAIYFSLKGSRYAYYATIIVGAFFSLSEIHHLTSSIQKGSYLVGTATGIGLVIMGILLVTFSIKGLQGIKSSAQI